MKKKEKKIYISNKYIKNTFEKTLLNLYSVDNLGRFPSTYHDSKFNNIQCKQNKSRSLYDVYLLLKTYFPYLTHVRYLKTVFGLIYTGQMHTAIIYCPDVKNLVLNDSFKSRSNRNTYYGGVFYNYGKYLTSNTKTESKFTIRYTLSKMGFNRTLNKLFN